jgi:galactose mutarotase-like enzyme
VIRVSHGVWALETRPARGGRITSLRLEGEELLDQGIGVDQPTADGFVESGAWGWDEMVPNIEPTESLPDHGEAWRLPWQVIRNDATSVVMRCRGRVVPWELERRIDLDEVLTVTYVYRNLGHGPHYAYWSAHPLFKYEADISVRLPDLTDGSSTKVFLPKGSIDHVRLGWRSGTRIEMRWDSTLTPYVAIWICNGDLGGYRQIAIEPATGGNDRPDPAAPPPLLEPGESYQWWLQITAL